MADDMMSKPRARTVRLACQAGALVLVAGGVAAALFGVPMLSGDEVRTVAFEDVEDLVDDVDGHLDAGAEAAGVGEDDLHGWFGGSGGCVVEGSWRAVPPMLGVAGA